MAIYPMNLASDAEWEPYTPPEAPLMNIPEGDSLTEDQDVELLRVAGRLELLTVEQFHALIYPHLTMRGAAYRVNRLCDVHGLLWRVLGGPIVTYRVNRPQRVEQNRMLIYGLSQDGKAALGNTNVETDEDSFVRLRARDPRGKAPSPLTLSHDLQCSWFCTQVLTIARRNRYVRSVYVQAEFYSVKAQRIDAYIIVRVAPKRPRDIQDMGPLPLFNGTPPLPDEIDIRIALEVDSGKEALPILLRKGETYGRLHVQGVYQKLYGGPIIPLLLVQRSRRADQIATQWSATWPDNWGIVTTPRGMFTHGDVMWGDYRSLSGRPSAPLLSHVYIDYAGQVQVEPIMDRATWDAGYVSAIPLEENQHQQAARQRWKG